MTGHVTGGLVTEAASLLVKPRPLGLCVTRGAQAGGLVIGAVVGPSLAPAGGGNVHVVQEPVSLRVPVSRGPGGRRGRKQKPTSWEFLPVTLFKRHLLKQAQLLWLKS